MRKQFLAVTIGVLLVLSVFSVLQFWQINPTQASDVLTDSYATTNQDDYAAINCIWHTPDTDNKSAMFQSFNHTSPNHKLTSAKFYLQKSGSPNGTLYYKLYSHSGTYGTSSLPDTLLATSAGLNVSTIASGSYALYELTFSGAEQYEMIENVAYIITIGFITSETVNADDRILVGGDWSSPSATGNAGWWYEWTGYNTWVANSGVDFCFYVYGTAEESDVETPTAGAITANTTLAGNGTQLSCSISDDVALSSYTYSTNNTGAWVNATGISVSGSSTTATWNSTWNATAGYVVSAKIYVNDTSNNWLITSQYNFTLTAGGILGTSSDLQTLINAASVNSVLQLSYGIYTFDDTTVTVNKNLTIVGGRTTFQELHWDNTDGFPVMVTSSGDSVGNGLTVNFTNIDFQGYVATSATTDDTSGMGISTDGDPYIVHIDVLNCTFQDFPNAAIGLSNSKATIRNCTFDNPYKDFMSPKNASSPYTAAWGYGIIVTGDWYTWESNFATLITDYDDQTQLTNITYSNFTRCRHMIASNGGGLYATSHCTFTMTAPYGMNDVHGSSGAAPAVGGRALIAHDNIYNLTDTTYSSRQIAFQLRGGGGLIYDNVIVFSNTPDTTEAFDMQNDSVYAPCNPQNWYIWNNTIQYANGNPIAIGDAINNEAGWIENTTYYLYSYYGTYYTLTVQSASGGTVSPTTGNHDYLENTNVTLTASPSGGYEFVDWEIDGANQTATATWYVVMDAAHTVKAYFTATGGTTQTVVNTWWYNWW